MTWNNDEYRLIIEHFDINKWNHLVDVLSTEPNAEIWENRQISAYRHNIHLKTHLKGGGVNLKYWHNAQTGNNMGLHKLEIKFNFNKVEHHQLFDWVCTEILYPHKSEIRIKSVDICTDLDTPISNVFVDRKRKKNTRAYNSTMYLGDRGRSGACKIYDKGAELGTGDVLTRFEVTIHPQTITGSMRLTDKEFVAIYSLPDVMVLETWQIGLEINPLVKAGVLAVLNGYMDISEFGRHQKKKIKDFMDEMKSFSINDTDKPEIEKALLVCVQQLIQYIDIVHNNKVFCKREQMPF